MVHCTKLLSADPLARGSRFAAAIESATTDDGAYESILGRLGSQLALVVCMCLSTLACLECFDPIIRRSFNPILFIIYIKVLKLQAIVWAFSLLNII